MHLKLKGVDIHVAEPEMTGAERDPSLLFIHGAGGDASIWNAQAVYFRGKYPVYRMELPGHGESGPVGEEEIRAYARWVRSVIKEAFPARPLVLVGHSMGGAVALDLALDPPESLKGVVLVGTGAKLGVMPEIFEMLEKDPAGFYETIDVAAFHIDTPRGVRDPLIKAMKACPPSIIFKDFRACDRFDIRDELGAITLPSLVLCGDRDKLTPAKYSRYLHENMAASRLEIIPGAGHMVMAEQTESVNRIMEEFLHSIHP